MADSSDLKTRTKTFRLSADEEAEVDAHLQRVGGSQSDFFRNAILARARGTVDFAEMLPMFAEAMERQMADLARSVQSHTAGIQTLAAAAVASSAMVLDDGKAAPSETARLIEDQIKRAVAYAPEVVSFLPKATPGPAPAGQKSR
jgi:uncharacterized protein (DUF1778 family)